LARLNAEKEFGAGGAKGQATVVETWRLARRSVAGPEEEVMKVWLWGLGDEEVKLIGEKRKIHEVKDILVAQVTREILILELVGITKRKHGGRVVTWSSRKATDWLCHSAA
jgi:hypothetical protein